MAITVTVENAQANLYQYLNRLDECMIDKVIVQDGGVNLFQIVTLDVLRAADPGCAAAAEIDLVATYTVSPGTQGKGLYRMVKKLRDKQAGPDAQKAVGKITTIPKASFVDGELITLINVDGDGYNFEFDVDGGGVTTGNVPVDISGDTTADEVATTLAGVIDGTGGFTASAVGSLVTVIQSDPGVAGNYSIVSTVSSTAFVVTGFTGGLDVNVSGGTVALFNSKNDDHPRAFLVPQDHADAIGL